jgi:hypothetical protein
VLVKQHVGDRSEVKMLQPFPPILQPFPPILLAEEFNIKDSTTHLQEQYKTTGRALRCVASSTHSIGSALMEPMHSDTVMRDELRPV